jgi:hypothetical protein
MRRNLHHERAEGLERFADGRIWRLKRGRDFEGSPRAFRETLQAEASRLGKVVAVVPDKLQRDRYVWVQFADGAIDLGGRCLCGSQDVMRFHRHWARCRTCGRLLDITNPDHEPGGGDGNGAAVAAADAPQASGPVKGLDAFSDLRLYRFSVDEEVEHCLGMGSRGASRSILSVKFPLEAGRRVPDPRTPGNWLYTVTKASFAEFGGVFDLDSLEDHVQVSWRIDEDRGPQPHDDFEEPSPT